MRRISSILAGGYALFFFLVPWAEAINIHKAEITGGAVVVQGNQAAKQAPITWEGTPVTQSNQGGVFMFSTAILPSDCVGDLSDGVTTIQVVVGGCTTQQVVGGGVLKTGQTATFNPGDDGDLELGAARSYTDNGDGTITDNVTGLMWEKLTNDATIHDKDDCYTWANAFAMKITDLNTANFAGHNDWRLPNINELQTLADYGRSFPAIDPAFNNGVDSFNGSSGYWSSTTFASVVTSAWSVNLGDGNVGAFAKTNCGGVRAVRGGSKP